MLGFILQALLFLSYLEAFLASTVIINEVAYDGSTEGSCNGEDWVELLNADTNLISLENYVLHDDKGPTDDKAYTFPSGASIGPGEYKVLCKDVDFTFGIGSSDTVTLLDDSGIEVSTSGALPGTGGAGMTFALFPIVDGTSDEFKYTTTATPGAVNVFTEPEKSLEELLKEQNALGSDFFRMNDDGSTRTSSTFANVVDLYADVEENDLNEIKTHPAYEDYVPFTQVRVVNGSDTTTLKYGGRIRTRGQSTLVFAQCFGYENVPFRLDFDKVNSTQTLFGMETAYLRNHLSDSTFMREHTVHRLNAKFGLPFLRTRHVRLYLNNVYTGFYTLMEAPDQAYVMQRSFGAYDPAQTALFKFKTFSYECGKYTDDELKEVEDAPTPDPFYFERGDHRDDIPIYGDDNIDKCYTFFIDQILKDIKDIMKGYLVYNKQCSEALVELGRVDRDFGPKSIETNMKSFLKEHIFNDDKSGLQDAIDVDQWIKNFASYAVLVNIDSPINNLNNWYIATTATGQADWRIVQYDHNNVLTRTNLCGSACDIRQIYWPILRPTCELMEDHPLLGPILSKNAGNLDKYIDYVDEFVSLLTPDFFVDLRNYGASIKDFVPNDPFGLDNYADSELSSGFEDYNTPLMPFIKTLEARKEQVVEQIKAHKAGTLPRNGVYGKDEICPDWRDTGDGADYIESGTYVPSYKCSEECEVASYCFSHSGSCSDKGSFLDEECQPALPCKACFPYSRCGALVDKSRLRIKGPECEPCDIAFPCFDHTSGYCAFDGTIIGEECQPAIPCKECFANSRCGLGIPSAANSIYPSFTAACGGLFMVLFYSFLF